MNFYFIWILVIASWRFDVHYECDGAVWYADASEIWIVIAKGKALTSITLAQDHQITGLH